MKCKYPKNQLDMYYDTCDIVIEKRKISSVFQVSHLGIYFFLSIKFFHQDNRPSVSFVWLLCEAI